MKKFLKKISVCLLLASPCIPVHAARITESSNTCENNPHILDDFYGHGHFVELYLKDVHIGAGVLYKKNSVLTSRAIFQHYPLSYTPHLYTCKVHQAESNPIETTIHQAQIADYHKDIVILTLNPDVELEQPFALMQYYDKKKVLCI